MRAVPVAMILGVCLVATASGPLTASDGRDGRDDRDDGKPYLALGDSVAFGFMPLPGFEAVNASNFVAYPDYLERALRLTAVNGACPGEASGSFLDSFAPDNGCRNYRAQLPLHVAFDGEQGDFAVEFLKANRQTRLVTIQLGANDLFLLRDRCFGVPSCIQQILPFTLAILEQNILTTIANLRATGYRRTIVLVNYFPLDVNDQQGTGLIVALNAALADAANRGGVIVADTFAAFSRVVSTSVPPLSSCRAGLLKANPADSITCDVHPSQTGHQLIASAIMKALRKAEHDH